MGDELKLREKQDKGKTALAQGEGQDEWDRIRKKLDEDLKR